MHSRRLPSIFLTNRIGAIQSFDDSLVKHLTNLSCSNFVIFSNCSLETKYRVPNGGSNLTFSLNLWSSDKCEGSFLILASQKSARKSCYSIGTRLSTCVTLFASNALFIL